MKAEIISIGTEILLGEITDTNASYLASELPPLGIDLHWVTQVGDNRDRIVDVLRRAGDRSDIVLVTGGLGPTEDDVTREAIAELLGENMTVDPELESRLRNMFKAVGYEMPEHNLRQAYLIPSARTIPNARGTAPGWWVERRERLIVAIPGPPNEMRHMWEEQIRPALRRKSAGEIIVSRTIKTLGLTEAKVDEMVSPLLSLTNPTLAVYSKPDGIHLRLTGKGKDRSGVEDAISKRERDLHDILGESIWGYDDDTMESLVGALLRERHLSLATMESCTGGLLASTVTDVPGSSDYFKGGLIAYTAGTKAAFGVDPELLRKAGTVDAEVALAMARSALAGLAADIGVGVTGVAGPTEIEGKPAGTVHIGIAGHETGSSFSYVFPPRRDEVKRRAVFAALFKLRQFLQHSEKPH